MKDYIEVIWHIDDVIQEGENYDRKISKEDARKILQNIEANHDAGIGINWEVISCHIDMYYQEKEKKNK